MHAVTDPLRLGVSVPQAAAILATQRPAAVFTTGGYMAVPVLMAAAPLRHPGDPVGRQRHPRSRRTSDRAAGDRAGGVVRGDLRGPVLGGARSAVLPDRHPDPGYPRRGPRGRPCAGSAIDPSERVLLVFGGSQAVRRFNAAVSGALPRARRAGHRAPCRGRGRLCRGRLPNARPCPRPFAVATGRTRSCATRCSRRWPRPTWSSGGPGRPRWPR